MKKYTAALAVLLLSAASVGIHAEIYKWTDAQGRTHFSDKQPAGGKTQVVKPNINTYSSPEIVQGHRAAPPTPAASAEVVMYSADWCGVCKKARAYFVQNNIPFSEYDVETDERGKSDFAAMSGRGVPIILVNELRMNGFSADQFDSLYRSARGQ
jgi:glutaredoxin